MSKLGRNIASELPHTYKVERLKVKVTGSVYLRTSVRLGRRTQRHINITVVRSSMSSVLECDVCFVFTTAS